MQAFLNFRITTADRVEGYADSVPSQWFINNSIAYDEREAALAKRVLKAQDNPAALLDWRQRWWVRRSEWLGQADTVGGVR